MARRVAVVCVVFLLWVFVPPSRQREDVRELLQNYQENQDLIARLGTRYEIVYPAQMRQDWVKGLSTRISANEVAHLSQTTFVIETVQFKFNLDLELNINLLAPTLVQLEYFADSHVILDKAPENCFYHATVRNHPGSAAALHTCKGLSGIIYFEDKIFLIHPLRHGNQSRSHPHLLYHHFQKEAFDCGNEDTSESCDKYSRILNTEINSIPGRRFIELSMVIDQTMFERENVSPTEVIARAVQVLNCADLLFHTLNTSLSIVYVELWNQNQIPIGPDVETSLNRFQTYAENRFTRISSDAATLMTGFSFTDQKYGHATVDSICTSKAVSLTKVENPLEPHLASYAVAHAIGHNLGMKHDQNCCSCSKETGCIMEKNSKFQSSMSFSSCSINDLSAALKKGHGACLLNMPILRTSVCGNGILEEEEQCDCGTSKECAKADSCCDPITCRFIKHAECSTGACCRKCKLLSSDHLCRPSRGECDIPDFCDGVTGQCPEDLHKRNGQICGEGFGYCYKGTCPVAKKQCRDIWGPNAESADSVCFERLNILGTPNGNCGIDGNGKITKCNSENSLCGSLQCHDGEKEPVSGEKPVQFVVNKIKVDGMIHECKSKSNLFGDADINSGLVKDGTKCGFHKLCVNRTCVKIRNLSPQSSGCPIDEDRLTCTGHGVCTNINTCYCEEEWTGENCELVAPEKTKEGAEDSSDYEKAQQGINDMKLNANLAVTVIAASMLVGIGLVGVVIVIFLYGKNILNRGCHSNHRFE